MVREKNLLAYKEKTPLLWVFFLGGTGTGKSTVFDAVCGAAVSAVGAERPKTAGAIGFVHAQAVFEPGFPFPEFRFIKHPLDPSHGLSPLLGEPGVIHLWVHDLLEWASVILVDTPDVDSVEVANRKLVETLWRLADLVVFVTSQEKYADEVPSKFLKKIVEEGTDVLVVCNKLGGEFQETDIREILEKETRIPEGALWLLPFMATNPLQGLPRDPAFLAFSRTLKNKLEQEEATRRRASWISMRKKSLKHRMEKVLDGISAELHQAHRWKEQLRRYGEEAVAQIIEDQHSRFSSETRSYLQAEIRDLFSRYDLLAGPRRWLSRWVTAPLRLLGLKSSEPTPDRGEALQRIKNRIHLGGIQAAIQRYGRKVLEETVPDRPESPIHQAVTKPGVLMTPEEVAEHVYREQELLIQWLEKVFLDLARDIPKGKKWGIYSTSVLWGLLILSLEVAVGGGLSVVDAVVDAAIAPFVTKGAVELFAYTEIQKIARQLSEKYRASLVSVVEAQKRRFEACLEPLMPSAEAVETWRRWTHDIRV
ncbi:MAG: hypothetical protein WHS46_13900 [Desulfosoma sp.]